MRNHLYVPLIQQTYLDVLHPFSRFGDKLPFSLELLLTLLLLLQRLLLLLLLQLQSSFLRENNSQPLISVCIV